MRPKTLGVIGLGAIGGSIAWQAALPDPFTGVVVYVTPIARGGRAASDVADFWKRVLGARPVTRWRARLE